MRTNRRIVGGLAARFIWIVASGRRAAQQCVAAELRHPCRKRLPSSFHVGSCCIISWLANVFRFVEGRRRPHNPLGERKLESAAMRAPRKIRRYSLAALGVVLFYVGSYCCLSASGGYCFGQSGRVRYGFGLSVSDISIWHPKFLYWQRFTNVRGAKTTHGNILGYVYCPLIALDRWLVHPTEQLIDPQS